MSFEAMRHHQRKVYLPLAIIVTVTFVFWGAWSASQRGCTALNQDEAVTLDRELQLIGEDLQSAGLIQPPPKKIYDEQAQREFADLDEALRDKRVRDQVRARCREYYRSAGLRLHYLPLKEGERLGVRVSDEDLGRQIRRFVEVTWGHKEFNTKAYQEELGARGLKDYRFENLIRGQMIRERLGDVLSASAGAFEAEQYYVYARERQQVIVQYFQRSPGEALALVEIRPGDRPAAKADEKPSDKPTDKPAEKSGEKAPAASEEKPAAPAGEKKADGSEAAPAAPAADPKAGEKTEEKAGEKTGEKTETKEPPKEEIGVLYEGEIPKKYEERCKQLKDAYDYKEGKDFEWPAWMVRAYPDIFTEARAGVECLLALTSDFEAGIKISDKDIEQYYNDNKRDFREKPTEKTEKRPKGEPKAEPKYKPLAEVRKEIEQKLVKRRAADAAAKALDAALKEYNDLDADKRPKQLAELAAKHKSLRVEPAVTGTLEELEEKKYLDSSRADLGDLFDRAERTKLAGKLTDRRPLDEDLGFLAMRVTEFHPVAMLKFEEAKNGFTHRLKYVEAWKLAKQSIDADLKALEDGKLDPARVRLSRLLGPSDETCEVVAASGQGKGEASPVYRYKQPLGPEVDEDKREQEKRDKAREGKKKPPREQKTIEERVVDALDADPRGPGRYRGYRVVILVERRLPTFEAFARDRSWRERWSPDPMYLQLMRRFGRGPTSAGDLEWRQDFVQGYYESRYDQLTTRG